MPEPQVGVGGTASISYTRCLSTQAAREVNTTEDNTLVKTNSFVFGFRFSVFGFRFSVFGFRFSVNRLPFTLPLAI